MLAIIAKQLFQLREIGVSSEAFSNSCGVERIGVCGELNAVSHSLSQIPDERLRVQHCAPPNDVAGNEFRFLIQSGKNPSISELARVILLHVASLLADESPYLIDLQITTGHFLHSFIEQRLGLLSGDKKQSHNHIPVQSSEPFGRADRAALKQTLNGLHPQFGVGCHGLPRQFRGGFAERGFAGSAAPALDSALTKVPETLACRVVTTGAGHVISPLALYGVYFVWMILLEQHAKQLISRDWNNQQNGASHADHKHPTQDMSENREQGIQHIHAPEYVGSILQQTTTQLARHFSVQQHSV